MFDRKKKMILFTLLAGGLVASPVLAHPAFAAGTDETAIPNNVKQDKLLNSAELQTMQPTKALEQRGLEGAQTFTNPQNDEAIVQNSNLPPQTDSTQPAENSVPVHDPLISSSPQKYASDELIIKFKDHSSATRVRQKYSLKTIKTLPSIGAEIVRIPKGASLKTLMAKLKTDPAVLNVQPNFKYQAASLSKNPVAKSAQLR